MVINIGSKNPVKLKAVQEVILSCGRFENEVFNAMAVSSGVSEQPIGLEEIIAGARNRAMGAYDGCELSVGLESGLIPVPLTQSGHMNLTACAIYDGSRFGTGLGPAFELSAAVTRLVLEEKLDLSCAVKRSGLTDHPYIGYSEGLIGILTRGRVTRLEYSKPAVSMALAGLGT